MHTSPTKELYSWLSQSYDFFNKELFRNELPYCLLTFQREKSTMGYFSPERWANKDGYICHEIAINPSYFAGHRFVEIFQTLVHEMCHLWQYVYGTPSRGTYHNKEWSDKMVSIGLIPTSNGEKGGKRTGQKMGDYPEEGGLFQQSCEKLVGQGFELKWIDRFPSVGEACQKRNIISKSDIKSNSISEILNTNVELIISDIVSVKEVAEKYTKKTKTKYSCPNCKTNIWGKSNLNIQCVDCNTLFVESNNG